MENFEKSIEKILKQSETYFGQFPNDIKQIIAANSFVNQFNFIQIIDMCNEGALGDMIRNNRQLFETIWKKYINTKIGEKHEKMLLEDFKISLNKKLRLYKIPCKNILANDKYKKYHILYKNAKNINKLFKILKQKDALYNLIEDELTNKSIDKLINKLVYVDQPINKKDTLLTLLSWRSNSEHVKSIIDKGADVNVTMTDLTPLMHACKSGNFEIIKLLVNNGANINYKSDYNPALIICLESNALEVYKFTPRRDYTKIIKFLISSGADIFIKGETGKTTLMVAAETSDMKLVKYLLKAGLNINAVDFYNHTALSWAIINGSDEMIIYLISMGANMNIINADGLNCYGLLKKRRKLFKK